MACKWKGKAFEPYTVPLLAMLLQENGALDPKIRGDNGYAFGISQHHICYRETLGKQYPCSRYGISLVEKERPEFSFELWPQFYQYSDSIRHFVEDGYSDEHIINSWNPGEYNRRGKVHRWELFVLLSTTP